jgi:hypothetical protein
MAVAYAARHPERVSHLLLLGTYARGWNRRGIAKEVLQRATALERLIEVGWGTQEAMFRQVFTSGFMPGASVEQQRSFNDMMRISAPAETAVRVFRAFGEIDVQEEARRHHVPCLIAHSRGDLRVPFEEGRHLATLIPGARFLPLEGPNHILVGDEPAWRVFLDAMDAFIPSGGAGFPQLTARERDVLELVAAGSTTPRWPRASTSRRRLCETTSRASSTRSPSRTARRRSWPPATPAWGRKPPRNSRRDNCPGIPVPAGDVPGTPASRPGRPLPEHGSMSRRRARSQSERAMDAMGVDGTHLIR